MRWETDLRRPSTSGVFSYGGLQVHPSPNGEEEEEPVEEAFALARDAEAVGEELLMDGEWRTAEIEAEIAVEAHRNGTEGTGPTIEIAKDTGNGHHGEMPEPQWSLVSSD